MRAILTFTLIFALFVTFAPTCNAGERYEYKLLELRTGAGAIKDAAAELNRVATDGWEVAATHPPFEGWAIFTLKRKL